MSKFKDKLINSCNSANSFLCVGLDPDPLHTEGGFCAWIHDIRFDYLLRISIHKIC